MTRDPTLPDGRLLGPDDPPPYEETPAGATGPFLVVCDHAARRIPRSLGGLGLSAEQLARHIGWDIGAAAVARSLAALLGAPLLASAYSRLVIDDNRWLDDPGSILAESDGTVVPGNVGITHEARRVRAEEIFWPYHRAVAATLDRLEARGEAPVLVSVHSFTPRLDGRDRPWHVGVLWDQDGRVAVPLLDALRRTGLTVGDNEPYTGKNPNDFTVRYHAERRGRRSAMVEIRQDEIDTDAGARRYAGLLAEALARAINPGP